MTLLEPQVDLMVYNMVYKESRIPDETQIKRFLYYVSKSRGKEIKESSLGRMSRLDRDVLRTEAEFISEKRSFYKLKNNFEEL